MQGGKAATYSPFIYTLKIICCKYKPIVVNLQFITQSMVWNDKLKQNKQLIRSVTEAGFLSPTEIQDYTLTRMIGGQSFIAIGPEGSGKTTAALIGVLARLKYGVEEAPRALILVPDKESVIATVEKLSILNKNPSIRVVSLYTTPGMEAQMNALADGADIVVATPDRARAIYLKLGLNLNKIIMLVIDDADLIVKKGMQLPVNELANSITRCQHIVFTEVLHEKLELMLEAFMPDPVVLEVDELTDALVTTRPQVLYNVPNFRTKLNLLNLLLGSDDLAGPVVVFVNTRLTAQKIFESLNSPVKNKAALLRPLFFDSKGFETIDDFLEQDTLQILIAANELQGNLDVTDIPTIIHFEMPEEKETYIPRVLMSTDEDEDEEADDAEALQAINIVVDIELSTVKKIEQATGQKMTVTELPADLVIYKEKVEKKPTINSTKVTVEPRGEAFHEKKASNNKDYNFSAGTKAKMSKKKKHG